MLDRSKLESGLVDAFSKMLGVYSEGNSGRWSLLHDKICQDVAAAYRKYYSDGRGDLMPVVAPPDAVLWPSLKPYLMSTWGTAFAAYWTATTFQPAADETIGVVTNGPAMGAALQAAIDPLLVQGMRSETVEAFARRIAGFLHTYTTGLVLVVTLNHPPWTKPGTIA